MEPKYLRVVWVDHHGSTGDDWWSLKEITANAKREWTITTVGTLIYEDERCIVLASESTADSDADNGLAYRKWEAIMKALIQTRQELKDMPSEESQNQ